MKKFFSLVLALVMALSLTTVAWGATDLQDAIDAATAGTETTVTLTADTTESITIPAGKVIKLDLATFKLTSASTGAAPGMESAHATITVEAGATLTVVGTGTVDNIYHGGAALWNKGGTVVLNGGTFTRSNENGINYPHIPESERNTHYTVYNQGTMTVNAGVSIVNGAGTASTLANEGTLTINGGSVTGGRHTLNNEGGATLVVNGGTFSGGADNVLRNRQTATINGGTFTGNVTNETKTGETVGTPTVSVSAGTFSADVSEYVADGYRLVNGTVSSVPANTTGVVGGYEGMFTTAGAVRQAVTNLTKTPAVAPLDLDEDGYYNRVGDRMGSIEYYTLNLGGAVAQNYYQVNSVNDADLIIYVGDSKTPYMYLANEPAGGFTYLTGAAAFNNFGKACGQFKWAAVDTTKTYYAYDGQVYVVDPTGAVNLMVNGVFTQATNVTANGTWVAHVPTYTQDKTGAVTAVKCANCPASAVIVANYAALPDAVKTAGTYFNVPGSASKMFYWVDGVIVTPSTDKVQSAETFDAGIAMYVGMSVLAATGSAVVLKKKD